MLILFATGANMFGIFKKLMVMPVVFALFFSMHNAQSSPVVMGYWENWGTYHGFPMPGSTLPNETMRGQLTGLTALAYAFLEVGADGSIQFTDSWADLTSKEEATNQFCAAFPQSCPKFTNTQGGIGSFNAFLKTPVLHVVSLGGAGHDATFDNAFNNPEQFMASLHALRNHFKGIDWLDLDYEPVNGIPAANIPRFEALIKRIKTEMPDLKLSYTLIANHHTIAQLGKPFWSNVSPYLDYIGVMGYDLHGAFDADQKTGSHASLYSNGDDFSVDKAIQTLINLDVARSKILLGMPMYGRAVGGVTQEGLGVPFTQSYQGDLDEATCSVVLQSANMCSGVMSYKSLVNKGLVNTANDYAYSALENMFVSYDNTTTVTQKAEYVNTQGLGGVFFWALRMDKKITHPQSLLAAVDKTFGIPYYQPERISKPKLYSYWAGWSNTPIPDFKLDGLVLAFAFLEKSGSGSYYTDYSKSGNFQNYSDTGPYATWQIKWLKKYYAEGARAYLSYGGGTDTNIRRLIIEATPEQLTSIAGEIKANVKQYWFDGVDLDVEGWWNYNKEQNLVFAKNFSVLVKALRESLDSDPQTRDKPIMIAVGADSASSADSSSYTGTMKPFYSDTKAVAAISGVFIMSYGLENNIPAIEGVLNDYTNAGVPEEKLFIGVSPYKIGQAPVSMDAIQALGAFVKKNNYGGLFVWAIGSEGLDTVAAGNYLKAMKSSLGV